MEVKLMDRYSWNSSKKPKGQGASKNSSWIFERFLPSPSEALDR